MPLNEIHPPGPQSSRNRRQSNRPVLALAVRTRSHGKRPSIDQDELVPVQQVGVHAAAGDAPQPVGEFVGHRRGFGVASERATPVQRLGSSAVGHPSGRWLAMILFVVIILLNQMDTNRGRYYGDRCRRLDDGGLRYVRNDRNEIIAPRLARRSTRISDGYSNRTSQFLLEKDMIYTYPFLIAFQIVKTRIENRYLVQSRIGYRSTGFLRIRRGCHPGWSSQHSTC